jgi:pimeloyl-ACP methyl ester carboxylesterase
MTAPLTAVLVHGAGHTSAIWRPTQTAMRSPSVAVDLPGRGSRPADITRVTVEQAADSVAADIKAVVDGDLVLVGHSVAGTVLPSVAARLDGRARHLVFIAGITGVEGRLPMESFLGGQEERVARRMAIFREAHEGATLEDLDVRTASAIDSLNFASQPMRWAGISDEVGRTFIRCRNDPIQSRDLQDRLIANSGATDVVDIDSGHTPATDAPEVLAGLLDGILDALLGGVALSCTIGGPDGHRPPSPPMR